MSHTPFASMPDSARVWVFGASQAIVGSDAERFISTVDAFVESWTAHGEPVVGACDWLYDRFLIIAADEEASGVSGCSIDSLYRILRRAEDDSGVTLLDSSLVFYRDDDGDVHSLPRTEFRDLVALGEISDATIVFDNTVGDVGAVRRGEWERPFGESWHARAFAAKR